MLLLYAASFQTKNVIKERGARLVQSEAVDEGSVSVNCKQASKFPAHHFSSVTSEVILDLRTSDFFSEPLIIITLRISMHHSVFIEPEYVFVCLYVCMSVCISFFMPKLWVAHVNFFSGVSNTQPTSFSAPLIEPHWKPILFALIFKGKPTLHSPFSGCKSELQAWQQFLAVIRHILMKNPQNLTGITCHTKGYVAHAS